tara:strand:- start:317 stop:673 length:357 start_codon:yes stop_codon:yes gene_type:complete
MTNHLILDSDYFPQAYEGFKEFELKIYKDEITTFKDNDTITVEDQYTGSFYTAVITRVNYFCGVDEAFEVYNYEKFIPDAQSKEHAKLLYEIEPGFKENVMNHGVLVFKITRISELVE